MWCAATAAVGAGLWAYKSLVVLVSGNQPDHVFEIAPLFFGVSVVTFVYSLMRELHRSDWLLASLSWLAATAGVTAAIAHLAHVEDGLGDPAYLVHFLSTLLLFFLIGGDIHRDGLLTKWSLAPKFLAWALLVAIPTGAILEAASERLLEVPLLAASGGMGDVGHSGAEPPKTDMTAETPAHNGIYALSGFARSRTQRPGRLLASPNGRNRS